MGRASPDAELRLVAILLLGTSACAPEPRDAPPSAETRVEETTDGLLELFHNECISQRNLQWAREESDRRAYYHCRALPGSLVTSEGKIGDCESEIGGHVEWTSRSTQGAPLELYLAWGDWNWPRERHAACGIVVPESLGPQLQNVANIVSERDLNLTSPPIHYSFGDDEYWQWSLSPPKLHLGRVSSNGEWELRLLVHPDFPENYNWVRDHVMQDCPLSPETNTYRCSPDNELETQTP